MRIPEYTLRSAGFSRCNRYRYWLRRIWDPALTHCVFIGLNPSTADAREDDPTLRRCLSFARDWGYGSLLLVNLFSFRATDPRALKMVSDPIGPRTDLWLRRAVAETDTVIAAWGNGGLLFGRGVKVQQKLANLYCLDVTALRMPRHPLYCPKQVTLSALRSLK